MAPPARASLNPNQTAIYAVLSADNGAGSLQALGFAVLDGIPEPQKYRKFIAIGESIETPMDTFGQYGNEELLTIHIVAEDTQDQSGWKSVKDADDRVVQLLDA